MFWLSLVTLPLMISPYRGRRFFVLDELGAVIILLSLWISGLIYISRGGPSFNKLERFYFLIGGLCLVLVMVFSCRNIISFYIFFEFSLIPITIIVLGWGYQPERLQASNYLVLYTVGARLPLLVSISFLFFFNGHTSFFLSLWGTVSFYNTGIWWVLTILAFLVKTPLYFFHLWLPKAHVEAPVAGSMILAGVLLKLGGYGIMRLIFLFQRISSRVSCFLTSVAIWGGAICSLICLRQIDIKALIAYSSITHMGVIVGGLIRNTVWGWQGALIMIISHGLVSSRIFLGAFIIYKVFRTRNLYFIKGVIRVLPLISFIWFFRIRANMGVPPTINLQSEIILVARVVNISKGFIIPLAISLFFRAAYSLLLYSSTQNGYLRGLSFFFFQLSYSDVVSIFLHLLPAYLLIVKGGMLIDWVY